MTPKTIITYLVDWNPSWIKTVEFSNRLIKWLSIPRKDFKDSLKRKELDFSWIYFLLWEDEDWNNLAYIGQATVLKNRLTSHYNDTNKDFWNSAICFTYKDWSLTESDINFLEKELITEAKKVNRYEIKNNTVWNYWLIQEHRMPDMEEFISDLKILILNLWYSVLKEVISKKEIENNDNLYYLKSRWSDAKWIYTEEWFIILKWSKLAIDNVNCIGERDLNKRNSFIEQKCKKEWSEIIVSEDTPFKSPSLASFIVTWSSMNWWDAWKDRDWKTLNENERQDLLWS